MKERFRLRTNHLSHELGLRAPEVEGQEGSTLKELNRGPATGGPSLPKEGIQEEKVTRIVHTPLAGGGIGIFLMEGSPRALRERKAILLHFHHFDGRSKKCQKAGCEQAKARSSCVELPIRMPGIFKSTHDGDQKRH